MESFGREKEWKGSKKMGVVLRSYAVVSGIFGGRYV